MKITKKELNRIYSGAIVRAGYCELQTLCRINGVREIGHGDGLYGWNWTAYEFRAKDGTPICVCTGYRDLTGERLHGLDKFEKKAKEIEQTWAKAGEDFNKYWKNKQNKLKRLATKFADYVLTQL